MAVTSEVSSITYAGDGVSSRFPIPFPFDAAIDIVVSERDSAGDVAEVTSGITVEGAGDADGGTVVYATPPGTDVSIVVTSAPKITQNTVYSTNDKFPAKTHEATVDRQARISQRLKRLIDACLRVPEGDESIGYGAVLPFASARKGKLLYFDLENGAPSVLTLAEVDDTIVPLTSTSIALVLNSLKRQAAEVTAGVTPVDYTYAPGNVRRYGAIGNGVADDSQAFADCTKVMAASASNISAAAGSTANRRHMLVMEIPPGCYRVTQKKCLSAAFAAGSPTFQGIRYKGHGIASSVIFYDGTDTDSDNYLASFTNAFHVEFCDLSFLVGDASNTVLRLIEWHGANGPSGTALRLINVLIDFWGQVAVDVTGSVLGDTYWKNPYVFLNNSAAVMLNVTSANSQSVDHNLHAPHMAGIGTFFKFRAGGNLRSYGGYLSFYDAGILLDLDADASHIGSATRDFLFDGLHPECSSGAEITMVKNRSYADVCFRNCNMSQMVPDAAQVVFDIGSTTQQRGGSLTFDNCTGVALKSEFNGGVLVRYSKCELNDDWQNFITLAGGTTNNRLSPIVSIDDCTRYPNNAWPLNPINCSPNSIERTIGGLVTVPVQSLAPKKYLWVAKFNNTGDYAPGLKTGYNDTYASFTVKIPLGAILTGVRLQFLKNGDAHPTEDRTFKVTNFDSSVDYIAAATFAGNARHSGVSDPLWVPAVDDDSRKVVIQGKDATGGAGGSYTEDYGYVVVEYI